MRRLLAWFVVFASPVFAATYDLTPSTPNWQQTLGSMQPGDVAILAAGTYVTSGRFGATLPGTAALPIMWRGGPGVIIRRNDTSQNLVDFANATFVTIEGIEFIGGSRGLRFQAGNDVTLRDCSVHDTDSSAITLNDSGQTYSRFHIVHNELHHTAGTGEGMYLGCNNDACRMQDSEIVGNWVHHTNGANVTAGFGTAIQLKEGGSGNVLRDNVVHDSGAPCILVDSAAGHGAANIVEGNLLFRCGDHGVQASQDAIIRNNVVLQVASDGIAVQPHQAGLPQNVRIVNNTVLVPTGAAVSVRNPSGSVVVANNALYAVSGNSFFANGTTSNISFSNNVGVGTVSGLSATLGAGSIANDFVSANAAASLPMNLKPKSGGALAGAGMASLQPMLDFDSITRGAADVGAYVAAGAVRWTLAEGFKSVTVQTSDAGVMTDAGADDAGAGGGSGGDSDGGTTTADGGTGNEPMRGGCGCSQVESLSLLAFALVAMLRRRTRSV